MQIGIRLHDTVELPLEKRINKVCEQGFSCVHLALLKVIKEYSVSNTALTPGLAMHIKRLFKNADLDIAVLGCYLNLANPDEVELKKIKDTYISTIRFASILGCGVVGTETGAPNKEYKTVPECRSEESLEVFINNLRPIVSCAEKVGVILAIEPVCRHIVYNAQRARKVLNEIDSPNLQIIFDPVNLIDISNYENREEVFAEAIELLKDEIAVVHIKDFVVKDDKLVSCAAGTGIMDYTQIMRFIKKDKPYIHVSLENTKPNNAVSARKYIEKAFREI